MFNIRLAFCKGPIIDCNRPSLIGHIDRKVCHKISLSYSIVNNINIYVHK